MRNKILYVEDDLDSRELLIADVSNLIDVDIASDKYECLNKLKDKNNQYKLILLDLCWGGNNNSEIGFEILKEIRRDYSSSQLPVIIYTDKGVEKDALRALREEAQDWLWKSSLPAEKIWRIQRAITVYKHDKSTSKRNISFVILYFLYGILSTYLSFISNNSSTVFLSIVFIVFLGVGFGWYQLDKIRLKTNYAELEAELSKSLPS